MTEGEAEALDADAVASKVNGRGRGEVPVRCEHLTAYVDVGQKLLFYAVCAWEPDFTGYVVDYGTYPEQALSYFTTREVERTMRRVHPGTGVEGAVYAGLEALCGQLLGQEWKRDDGAVMRIGLCFVDQGWLTDVVHQFCRQSRHAALLMLARGHGITASQKPISEYDRKRGDRIGHHWWVPSVKGRRALRHVEIDTNYWKSFVHERLGTAMGDPGCLSIFGRKAVQHRLFAEHVTSEYRVRTEGRGRTVDEWKLPAHKPDNSCPPLAELVRLRGRLRSGGLHAGRRAHRRGGEAGRRAETAQVVQAAAGADVGRLVGPPRPRFGCPGRRQALWQALDAVRIVVLSPSSVLGTAMGDLADRLLGCAPCPAVYHRGHVAQRFGNPRRGADRPLDEPVGRTAMMTATARLARLNVALLAPVVRSALGKEDLVVTTWDCQVVKADRRADGRLVCRVSGRARADGRDELCWSVFLKVPNATATHYDSWHREPFQREVLLYESGFLVEMPGGIVAPRLLGLTHWSDDEPWMWLEDVTGLPGLQWPVERFAQVARQFGRMQGAFLAGRALPDLPWLRTGHWLREQFVTNAARAALPWQRFAEHPLTRSLYRSDLGRRVADLWDRREAFLCALEAMPCSLCHGDFNYTNFFAPQGGDDDRTFVVDWQYAGWRQIGGDIAGLIADCSIGAVRRKAAEPAEFLALVLPAWLEGLHEAGWDADPDVPRFACLARLAVPWTFNLLQGLNVPEFSQPLTKETEAGLEDKVRRYVSNQQFLLALADEARVLLDRAVHRRRR